MGTEPQAWLSTTAEKLTFAGQLCMRAFETLEFGVVLVNDVPTFRVDSMPFGGVKHSGLGREGVRWAVTDMTEERLLVLAPEPGTR